MPMAQARSAVGHTTAAICRSLLLSDVHPKSIYGGKFPLSKLVALSNFQSLSSLSVRIIIDGGVLPTHKLRLELPNLERFGLQVAVACHRQVDAPIYMICRKLKVLDLRYALE